MTPAIAQRMNALERANDIRLGRANLKRDLKAGRTTVANVIASPPECAESMALVDLLIAAPHWGRVRASKALARCHVGLGRQVGALTYRERAAIVDYLDNLS